MSKKRPSIPKAISEQVLKEYHHKCAMCGRHDPQLHHIDENPGNNDPANLIPLCPNCHLQDTHSPTAPVDAEKVRLFRRCKDPFIMDARFHPIWVRLRFLRDKEDTKGYSWNYRCSDLVKFVRALKQGDYYGGRIDSILRYSRHHVVAYLRNQGREVTEQDLDRDDDSKAEMYAVLRTEVENLCVEMLRYQDWSVTASKAN